MSAGLIGRAKLPLIRQPAVHRSLIMILPRDDLMILPYMILLLLFMAK